MANRPTADRRPMRMLLTAALVVAVPLAVAGYAEAEDARVQQAVSVASDMPGAVEIPRLKPLARPTDSKATVRRVDAVGMTNIPRPAADMAAGSQVILETRGQAAD